MKKVLVAGGGGFIGHHLARYLKSLGYWVRVADIKFDDYMRTTDYDDLYKVDLTDRDNCMKVTNGIDEVYQLAAQMGGMGFISKEHIAAYHDSNLINTYMAEACAEHGVKKVFFSSSACIYPNYRQRQLNMEEMHERDSMPADPNEGYGWEKLFAENRYLAYHEAGKFECRIARFENCYGPEGTWRGGREKAPAAMCRKAAKAKDGDHIEVWGDGKAQRSYMYVDDLVVGIHKLMESQYHKPLNLGSDRIVTVDELAQIAIDASGKKVIGINHVPGPEGVRSRIINHDLAKYILNWEASTPLEVGIKKTYDWINSQL